MADEDRTESEEDREPIDVIGELHTHWTCEECGEVNEEKGDAKGDVVVCGSCGTKHCLM